MEEPIKEGSRHHYSTLEREMSAELTCGQYFKKVEEVLEEEKSRLEHSLAPSSIPGILRVFQREMLLLPQKELFEQEDGLKEMFAQRQEEDLSRIFRLYLPNEPEGGLEPLGLALKNSAFREGTALIE